MSNSKKAGGSAQPIGDKPRLLGSWFYPEFRTLTQAFDLAGKAYTEESKIDVFSESGLFDFNNLNPAMTGVCAYLDKEKVVADPVTLTKFMCRSFQMTDLYPTSDVSKRI